MQQKLKAEILTICEPSRRLGIDHTSHTSLLFKSNFVSILWAPLLRRDEVNCQVSMPNQIRFTHTPFMWWCWRAMNSCSEPICICSIAQYAVAHWKWKQENQVSYSVLPLRCMYLLAISVSLQIILIAFNQNFKKKQNFGLKQEPYEIPTVNIIWKPSLK